MTASIRHREISARKFLSHGHHEAAKQTHTGLYFAGMRLRAEVFLFEAPEVQAYLEERAPGLIKDIISHRSFSIILTDSGLAVAWDRRGKGTVHVLNQYDEEKVCALFHNQKNDSLVLVSRWDVEWNVRAYYFEDIEHGEWNPVDIFGNLQPQFWPSSIQFDELNAKMLTHHTLADSTACVVYDLLDYKPLYCLTTTGTLSVQISQDLLVMTVEESGVLHFRIHCMETGELLRVLHFLLLEGELEFSVAFNEAIIIKPRRGSLFVLNIVTGQYVQVGPRSVQLSRSFLVPLRHRFFISRYRGIASVWSFRGERLAQFSDTNLFSNLHTVPQLGRCVAFRFVQDGIEVVDVSSGLQAAKIPGRVRDVHALHFDPIQNALTTAFAGGIQIWN